MLCFIIAKMRFIIITQLVLLVLPAVESFVPIGNGNTHVTITGNAVMKKISEVCKAVAESDGRPFNPTVSMVLTRFNSIYINYFEWVSLFISFFLFLCVIGFLCRRTAACMFGYKIWSGVSKQVPWSSESDLHAECTNGPWLYVQ